jgi:hypothetical protein
MNLKRFDIFTVLHIFFLFLFLNHTFKYDALQQEARLLNTMRAISSVSSVVVVASAAQNTRRRRRSSSSIYSARNSIASSSSKKMMIRVTNNSKNQRKRNINTTIKAKDEGFEVPDFVKDLMKPPDSSIAAPGWLAPLLGLAKESGESAVGIGYALMIVTSVFFSLVFAVIGLPGFLCALIFVGASGYTCWQATPYLNEIVKEVESGFTDDD